MKKLIILCLVIIGVIYSVFLNDYLKKQRLKEAINNDQLKIVKTIIKENNWLNISLTKYSDSPLELAVWSGSKSIVKFLIEEGAIGKKGRSKGVIFEVVETKSFNDEDTVEMIKYLMGKGFLLNKLTGYGNSLLHIAVHVKKKRTIEFLIKNGVKPIKNKQDQLLPVDLVENKQLLKHQEEWCY